MPIYYEVLRAELDLYVMDCCRVNNPSANAAVYM